MVTDANWTAFHHEDLRDFVWKVQGVGKPSHTVQYDNVSIRWAADFVAIIFGRAVTAVAGSSSYTRVKHSHRF